MNTYTELTEHCTAFSEGFASIHEIALEWGYANHHIAQGIQKIVYYYREKNASTEYVLNNAHTYLLAEIFQNPENIRLLMGEHERDTKPEGSHVLTSLEKDPAFWCYFSVKEHLCGDLWSIVDHMSGEEHTLYSQVITAMQKWEDAQALRFLGLLLPNGECLQSVGITKHNRLTVSDFLYYCSLFKPERGLKAILGKHFAQFSELDQIRTWTPTIIDSHEMGFAWHSFTLPDFSTEKLSGTWIPTTLGDHQFYTIRAVDTSMLDLSMRTLFETDPKTLACSFIKDNATGEMALFTNTEVAFTLYADMLNKAYPTLELPQKPSVFIGAALHALIQEIGLPVPWKKYEAIIGYRKSNKSEHETYQMEWEGFLEEFSRSARTKKPSTKDIIELLDKAQTRGIKPDVDAVCKATGLQKDDAELIMQSLALTIDESPDENESGALAEDLVYIVPEEDRLFELQGWHKPDDGDGSLLRLDLTDSEFFDFNNIEEAYKSFVQLSDELYLQEIRKYGMVNRIEALFTGTFADDLSFSCMNTFFWLLYHHGREWTPVRSYAIEMLKWIPDIILHCFDDSEKFIELFSLFTKKFLCTKGICSLKARPTAKQGETGRYAIKGTEAFYSLLKVREE